MKKILEELNRDNGSNYKLDILKKHKDNFLFQRILKLAYDRVQYTYGITTKSAAKFTPQKMPDLTLEKALDILEEKFTTREVTGHAAGQFLSNIIHSLDKDDAEVFCKIVDRDLKINLGRSQINKVHKNLIVKPAYMRCSLWNEKTKAKFKWPLILQQKADGTYRAVTVDNGEVIFQSRSGEISKFPELLKSFKDFPDGVYIGELLVRGESNRAVGNGLINSDNPPHDKIYMQLWDLVNLDEYQRPKDKKNKTIYKERLNTLQKIIKDKTPPNIELIPTRVVLNEKQAMSIVSKWMKDGFEGGVIKDPDNIFVDHTSPTQCKIKLIIDADVRLIGFEEGTPGTKREKTFGAMVFKTDDGKVQGRTSGFTDKQLQDFNNRREELIGQIFTVEFNDITRARNSETYALSHPRFIEFRPDKDKTDTLERIFEMREMATGLKEIT